VAKKDQRKFSDDEGEQCDDKKDALPLVKEEIKVNKKKLKKITKDGPFDGKNKVFFDANGKPMSSLEYHLNLQS